MCLFITSGKTYTIVSNPSSVCLSRDKKEVNLGDDNALTLTFNARNEGEGGAYEAELYVVLPPEADYSGIARNNEVSGVRSMSFIISNSDCIVQHCLLVTEPAPAGLQL